MVDYFNTYSDPLPINSGVPQGSILGPLLPAILVNDLPNAVNSCSILMYADDTVIFYGGKSVTDIENVVSADLDALNSWLNTNKLFLHADKSECVLFGSAKRLHTVENFEISINGQRIKQVFKYKYLGVVMDDSLSWRDHVHHALMKASARVGMLRRLRNDISMHTANIVYKSYVLPTLDYCDTVWNCCNVGDEEKLEKIQRRAARVVMKVNCSDDALHDLR